MGPAIPTESNAMDRCLSDGNGTATYILPDIFKFLDSDSICSAWAVSQLWRHRAEAVLQSRLHFEEQDQEDFCGKVNTSLYNWCRLIPSGEGVEDGPKVVSHPCKLTTDQVQQVPAKTATAAEKCDALLVEEATPLIVLKVIVNFNWGMLRSLHLWETFAADDWNLFGRFILSRLTSLHTMNVVLALNSKARMGGGFGALMDVVRGAGGTDSTEPNTAMTTLMISYPVVVNPEESELPLKPLLELDFLPALCPNIKDCNFNLEFTCQAVNQDKPEMLGTVKAVGCFRKPGEGSDLLVRFASNIADSPDQVPDLLKTTAALGKLGTELQSLAALYQYERLTVVMIDDLDLVSAALATTGTHFRDLYLYFHTSDYEKAHYVLAKAMKKWSADLRFVHLAQLNFHFFENEKPDSERSTEETSWMMAWRGLVGNSVRRTEDGELDTAMGMTNVKKVHVYYGPEKTHQGKDDYCSVIMTNQFWSFVFGFLPKLITLHTNANFKRLQTLTCGRRLEKTVVHRHFNTNEEIQEAWDEGLLCTSNFENVNSDTTWFQFLKGTQPDPDLDLGMIDRLPTVSLFGHLPF